MRKNILGPKHILLTNCYRLILTSVLVTSKFYNDVFYGNHFVAYIGGIDLSEMNILEIDFLKHIEWKLWVDLTEYDNYMKALVVHFNQMAP